MIFVAILLLSLTNLAVTKTQTEDGPLPMHKSDCAKYGEPWRIAQCASSLLKDQLISKSIFVSYLQLAIKKITPDSTFYGAGFTTGLEKKLVAGKIEHPVFAGSIGVSYDPRDLYHERVLVDFPNQFDKPVLIFSTTKADKLPHWNSEFLSNWQHEGMRNWVAGYQADNSGKFENTKSEDCSKLSKWITEKELKGFKNVAIVMDPSLWCPSITSGIVEIVVAEMESDVRVGVSSEEDIYRFNWMVWKGGSFGAVPSKFMEVFRF